MGQSLVKNYIHLSFSTKGREPIIHSQIEGEMYAYLGGICNNLGCQPIQVGGYLDHVHILCLLSKKIALMKLLEIVKANSSRWIKSKGDIYKGFHWQDGYGAFSVSPSGVEAIKYYIQNQKEHHARTTFKDEFRTLLKKYNVDYDERYIWD